MRQELREEIGSVHEETNRCVAICINEIASLHRLILQVADGTFATFAIGFAGLVVARL